jgi:serine/threonine protein kinase
MGWKRGKKLYGDRYIIEQELGKGGTGITYLAKTKKGKLVVIKTLKDEILNDPYFTEFANKYQNEFRDEALRLALCRHPHIVQIENVFNEGNLPCIAMEYLGGENLSDRVKEAGPLPETEALTYIWQIGEAVMAIHDKGLLHRDVKPRNIIVRPSQNGETEAVLIDFGIAREFIPELAMTHTAAGSNGFAPIEQYAEKAPRGEYTDIYSLAGTLYYLLTAEVPIPAPTRAAKIALNPPEEFNPKISDRVRAAIVKGMEFEPEKRPQSIQDWLELLGDRPLSVKAEEKIALPTPTAEIYYTQLQNLLAAGKWKDADAETRGIMMKVLGRKTAAWENKEEIQNFPCHCLKTIDKLWIKYSRGRFGFSIQKQIWQEMGGTDNADSVTYNQFLERIGWVVDGSWLTWHEFTFNFNAPLGHLPMGLARGKVDFGIAFLALVDSCQSGELAREVPEKINYRQLRDLLAAEKWREADEETIAIMLKIAGKSKDDRLSMEDLENFPCSELKILNELWEKCSEGRFGFKVQKSIYFEVVKGVEERMGKEKKYYKMIWEDFSDALGWRVEGRSLYYNELNFSLDAPRGHWPVLWCIKFKVEVVGVGLWRETFFNRVDSCLK